MRKLKISLADFLLSVGRRHRSINQWLGSRGWYWRLLLYKARHEKSE